MAKSQDPFRTVLWQASDRLFVQPFDLAIDLDTDPQGTLYRLSTAPEAFAPIKPALTDADRLHRHQQLLTAAKAYIVAVRKLTADAVDQGELPLPE